MTWTAANTPSVTRVLGIYQDWSSVPQRHLEHAAARGTAVHGWCYSHVMGEWRPDEPGYEITGYLESFKRWFDENIVEVVAAEIELVHPALGYHGHPDLVCRFKGDDDLLVVDYKTPRVKQKIWSAQLAAYDELVEANGLGRVGRSGSLMLDIEGGRARFTDYQKSPQDLAAFVAALAPYRYFVMEN